MKHLWPFLLATSLGLLPMASGSAAVDDVLAAAVTYGILQSVDGSRRALYVRVWSRERRRWQVAVDLHTPVPVPAADP